MSVALYIVVPVIIAQVLRSRPIANGTTWALDSLLAKLQPMSIVALLATLVLLFAFQGEQIIEQPTIIWPPTGYRHRNECRDADGTETCV